jgi:vanillate O-demethylase monooxygenase subunit
VWIWGGEFESADERLLPHPGWLGHPDWDIYIGYLNIKGSYVHMHENLLDLSHLSFLHETTFGTPEYARAPVEITVAEPNFEVWRHVECVLPGIYARPLGWEGQKSMRSSGAQFVAPGLHVNTGILRNLSLPPERQEPGPTIRVAQLITPEDQHTVHYYFAACRNFARHDPEIDAFMLKAQTAAFSEDLFAIERIAALQAGEAGEDFYEVDVAADRAGVAMRRYLKKLSDAEIGNE